MQKKLVRMGRYIDVDESYDADAGTLGLYLVEDDGVVAGIYWDEDFAIMNARETAANADWDSVVMRQVDFRRDDGEVVFDANEREPHQRDSEVTEDSE